ncbi:MAG: recombination mediator RecR [Defluviitaleaceae bacterium]|nr:recombination mediator RecR [Defluviitaleaceae bacterium]
MNIYGNSISRLIEELNRLPGVGAKSAARIAFYIMQMDDERVKSLTDAIILAKTTIKHCEICQAITDISPCNICSNSKRDISTIMVVEDSRDMAAYEKTKEYKGLYHVLNGAISPMAGISPENLKIKELLARINGEVNEIILATNPNVEGEATAMYINKLLKDIVNVTRIAYGVPIGGDLEYVDHVTLARALEGRREIL